jgi:uncharacterized membrane protein
MKFKTVKIVEWITCIVMPAVLAVTVIFHLWYLPLVFFLAAAIMFGILISRLKEVYEDEMTHAITEKGGAAAINIGCILMILTGSVLLANNDQWSSGLGIAAITLFATSFGLSLISLFTKMYYQAKLGGKN